jgi:hypothetical protein
MDAVYWLALWARQNDQSLPYYKRVATVFLRLQRSWASVQFRASNLLTAIITAEILKPFQALVILLGICGSNSVSSIYTQVEQRQCICIHGFDALLATDLTLDTPEQYSSNLPTSHSWFIRLQEKSGARR